MCGKFTTANGLSHRQSEGFSLYSRFASGNAASISSVTSASRGAGFATVTSEVLRTQPIPGTSIFPDFR